ncbi:MAG: VOC family protein [Acidimicrobiales bacterium]
MLVTGIHHVSINVTDFDAAEAFYSGVLGMTKLERPELSVKGAWLNAGDGREVHLIVADPPPDAGQHFAFLVDDVDEVRTTLAASGIETDPPGQLDGVCRQVFCHDPSGNRIEFNQRL